MSTATLNTNNDFAVGSSGDDATHWTLWSALSSGTLYWSSTVAGNPAALGSNQYFRIAANNLILTLPIGSAGATAAFANYALTQALQATTYVQMHSGAPGNNGTSNILTSVRIAITSTEWTFAA